MKMKETKKRNRGFSLAETLVVVAILIILAGLGSVSVVKYQRNLKLLELDGIAKEIFVAAQNHISVASGQAYLGREEEEEPENVYYADDDEDGVSFFVVGSSYAALTDPESILGLILPANSIDETVRTGGSYIIRFQRQTGTIMDVFYSEKSGKYAHTLTADDYESLMSIRDDKDARKNYGEVKAVIGYYGGASAQEVISESELLPPILNVANGDILSVTVGNLNDAGKISMLKLFVQGKESNEEKEIPLFNSLDLSNPEKKSYSIVLDDITASGSHFINLFPGFTPGEDLVLKAVLVSKDGSQMLESAVSEVNSLFAYKDGSKVGISSIRHLENLDPRISDLDNSALDISISSAEQTADLSWKDFSSDYSKSVSLYDGTTAVEGNYIPVMPGYSLAYDGKASSISDVRSTISGNAGLFASLEDGSIKDLFLVDFDIESTAANAGALAGSLVNTDVSGVLAYNDKTSSSGDAALEITASGSAGGLIGVFSGVSSTKVAASAAAVYVVSENANAGGLIGTVSGVPVITDSYSGGHTVNARFQDDLLGEGRTNVQGQNGYAGGLIGDAAGASISYSYSTCSVIGFIPGGFVGNIGNGTVSNCYTTGRVSGVLASGETVAAPVGAFAGSYTDADATFLNTNYYLNNMSASIRQDVISNVTGVSGKDSSCTDLILPADERTIAYLYDPALDVDYKGCFYFPTIEQWHINLDSNVGSLVHKAGITDFHHGDFQIPNLDSLDISLHNGDTLYLDVDLAKLETGVKEFTVAVTGNTSSKTKAFLVNIESGTPVIKDEGILNGSAIQWKGSPDVDIPVELVSDDAGDHVIITLDDITVPGAHFAELFGDSDHVPGEDISVRLATERSTWTDLSSMEPVTDNSLFAKRDASETATARITTIRHLQNLDPAVSEVGNAITQAELLNDIDWNDADHGSAMYGEIYSSNSAAKVSGSFYGIYNSALRSFVGNENTLSNFRINGAPSEFSTAAAGNAGLFRKASSLTVSDLELADFDVSASSGNAAVLIADADGAISVDTVLVRAADGGAAADIGVAGGLIGVFSGSKLDITNSAAVVLVRANGAAGGLVGSLNSGDAAIEKSYVGGHTVNAEFDTGVHANVYSSSSVAGGLVGDVLSSSGSLKVEKSFSAASVQSASSAAAGGIAGHVGISANMSNVYAIAPVYGTKYNSSVAGNPSAGAFVGIIDSGKNISNTSAYYLPEVYEGSTVDIAGNTSSVSVKGNCSGTLGQVSLSYYERDNSSNAISAKTHQATMQVKSFPYDSALSGSASGSREYPFSIWTSFSFDAAVNENKGHKEGSIYGTYYGDWQPILTPATVPLTASFKYLDPRDGKIHAVEDASLSVQQIFAGQSNSLMAPLPPAITGYEFENQWTICDSEGNPFTSGGGNAFAADESRVVSVDRVYCNSAITLLATYKRQGYSIVNFYYDPSGSNTDFEIMGSSQRVENKRYCDIALPQKNVPDYELQGWYADPEFTTRIDFSKSDIVSGDINAYAKYVPLEYFTITVDFMYTTASGDTDHLLSVPRYRIENTSQYQIRAVKGKTFDQVINLPQVQNGSEDNVIADSLSVENCDANFTDEEKKTAIHVTATSDASVIVEYIGQPKNINFYPYRIMYRMYNTSPSSTPDNLIYSAKHDDYYDYNPYAGESFLAPDGFELFVDAEDIPGFSILNHKSQTVLATDDITENTIYVDYERSKFVLSFNSDGGSYVQPKSYYYGQAIDTSAKPERKGYVFNGWMMTELKTSEPFNGATMPASAVNAVARWTPGKTTYTVIYWKQNVGNDRYAIDSEKTYDYDSMVQYSNVDVGSLQKLSNADKTKNYPGFEFNAYKSAEDVAGKYVAADGSTVLNAYYDRKAHIMRFSTQSEYGTAYLDNSDKGVYRKVGNNYYGVYKAADGNWYYDEVQTVTKTRTNPSSSIAAGTKYTGTVYRKQGDEYVEGYNGFGTQYYGYDPEVGYFALNLDRGYTYKYKASEAEDYTGTVIYRMANGTQGTFNGTQVAAFSDPNVSFYAGVVSPDNQLLAELYQVDYQYGTVQEKTYTGQSVYVETDSTYSSTDTKYYWNGSGFYQLYWRGGQRQYWSKTSNGSRYDGSGGYYKTTTNATSNIWGVVSGKKVELSVAETSTVFTYQNWYGSTYNYTGSDYYVVTTQSYSQNPDQYASDGTKLTYNSSKTTKWRKNGSGYNGTRYAKASATDSNLYGLVSGYMYPLTKTTAVSYKYVDSNLITVSWPATLLYASSYLSDTISVGPEPFTGSRYITVSGTRQEVTPVKAYYHFTRMAAKEHEYTKSMFYDANGNPKEEMSGGDLYCLVNGNYYKLTRSGEPVFSYRDTINITVKETYTVEERVSQLYEGPRYRLEGAWYYGIFGQPLSKYGYSWPDGLWNYSYNWNSDGNSGMSYLGEFVFEGGAYDRVRLSKKTSSTQKPVYFYLETEEEGVYPTIPSDTGHLSSIDNFGFTDKYDGYTVASYSTRQNPSAGDWTSASAGGKADGYNIAQLHIRYARKTYSFSVFNTQENAIITSQNVKFGMPLAGKRPSAAPAPSSILASQGYEWDGKYYADAACTKEFDFDKEQMPSHGLQIYVKFVRPKFDVSFTLVDPTIGETGGAVYKANSSVGYEFNGIEKTDTIEQYITMDGELADAYIPQRAKHTFLGWFYMDGSTEKEFLAQTPVTCNMTIYPKWLAKPTPGKTSVTVIHAVYDETKDDFTGEIFEQYTVDEQEVGSLFSAASKEYLGYYPLNTAKYLTVRSESEKNVITLFYQEIAPWTYTVEYYAIYGTNRSVAEIDGFETNSSAYLISRQSNVEAYNRYEIVDFTIPAGFEEYHLHHNEFVITENGEEYVGSGTDSSLMIHPGDDEGGRTGTAVVKCYIEPEYDSITVPGLYKVYDGVSVADSLEGSGAEIELSSTITFPDTVTVSYQSGYEFYEVVDDELQEIEGKALKDVGAYIMNGYLGVAITGTAEGEDAPSTKKFLICQDESYDLKLVIDRRPIIIESGSATASYDPDNALKNSEITVYGPDGTVGTGFVNGDGATYQFSVEAFRLSPGTSDNSFTYTLNEGTNPLNYKITTKFGKLTVR